MLVATAGQASHAKAGDGVARQSFAVCLREVLYVDLSGTERVVAQDDGWRRRIDQHVGSTDALAPVLLGEPLEVLIQRWHTAVKPLPIMDGLVETLLLKHA